MGMQAGGSMVASKYREEGDPSDSQPDGGGRRRTTSVFPFPWLDAVRG